MTSFNPDHELGRYMIDQRRHRGTVRYADTAEWDEAMREMDRAAEADETDRYYNETRP